MSLETLLATPKPLVMGILNITPDSFSDGGKFVSKDSALTQVEKMLEDGADIIDIGGESTRPGAAEVPLSEELERVIPLIEAANSLGAVVSIDTSKAGVMAEAVKSGAQLINDVRALQEPGALDAAAESGAYICLMHMQGKPRTMQHSPHYDDVVAEVQFMLRKRVAECEAQGIEKKRLMIDPGFGFGKNLEHNCQLMKHLDDFKALGLPVLVGVSRKSMIGQILDTNISDRMLGSVVAASYAALKGAKILRVHDVKETVSALKIINAFE